MPKFAIPLIIVVVIAALVIGFGSRFLVTVPVGHVGVASLFGEVQEKPYSEGLTFPVNPLYKWNFFDARQKTHLETVNVPSQDQLKTKFDVSVQFRLNGDMAAELLKDTGTFAAAVNVHLIPTLRSILREQGKTIEQAEDFFLEETHDRLQATLLGALQDYLGPKGIYVEQVFIRDITLPPFITRAIEAKKEREQEVDKQKAELERFRTEQQQLVASAEAERQAAEQEAQKRRVLADAQAYEIEALNKAIANNPADLQLQALEALKAISENPSSKIYFLNSDSPMPLPLMHMGDVLK